VKEVEAGKAAFAVYNFCFGRYGENTKHFSPAKALQHGFLKKP